MSWYTGIFVAYRQIEPAIGSRSKGPYYKGKTYYIKRRGFLCRSLRFHGELAVGG